LVVAKTDRAHKALSEAFADHGRDGDLERAYVALVWGAPPDRQARWTLARPRRIVCAAPWCPKRATTPAMP
jgi:23S rRNA-/tRNA-specific pseudouridylate synthase